MPVAMRTDVIDEILAIALHPAYDCKMTLVSASIFLNLTQSPETHVYIVRREVVEKMLEMCELKQKIVAKQVLSQGEQEDPMAVNGLKYVTITSLYSLSLSLSLSLTPLTHTHTHTHTQRERERRDYEDAMMIISL